LQEIKKLEKQLMTTQQKYELLTIKCDDLENQIEDLISDRQENKRQLNISRCQIYRNNNKEVEQDLSSSITERTIHEWIFGSKKKILYTPV